MNIKILMCCHKSFTIVPPLCIPIQGGRAINPAMKSIQGDDNGNNISEKNREYCELTVQYYAWKNIDAQYYGFCHYRRFFGLDENIKTPYIALKEISHNKYERYLGNEEQLKSLCDQYDVIVTRSEDMGINVRDHYITSAFHHREDLELFLSVLEKKAPQLLPFANEYLYQNKHYFCNMFIMNKVLFNEYCDILFTLLEEFDSYKTIHGHFQDDRTDGYLGERFLGIYLAYLRSKGTKIKELPRIDIGCSSKKILMCRLLPPQSRSRFIVKKIIKKIRG